MKGTKRGTEKIFETIILEDFPKINLRYQTRDSGSLEHTKKNKCQKNAPYLGILSVNLREAKVKMS